MAGEYNKAEAQRSAVKPTYGMSRELSSLYRPQVEQLGVKLERYGNFWHGEATTSHAQGTMWLISPTAGCLVIYHDVRLTATLPLIEESDSVYACVCELVGDSLPYAHSCGLAPHVMEPARWKDAPAFANFIGKANQRISCDLLAGQRYCSSSIILLPEFVDELSRRYPGEFTNFFSVFGTHVNLQSQRAIRRALSRITTEPPLTPGGELRLHAAVDELVASLAAQQASSQEPTSDASLTQAACELIAEALDSAQAPPTTEELAHELYVSRSKLSAAFREETGMPLGTYARLQRLERACELLYDTHVSIAEIAERLGYASTSAMTHAFMKVTGVSPRTWRAQQVQEQRERDQQVQ